MKFYHLLYESDKCKNKSSPMGCFPLRLYFEYFTEDEASRKICLRTGSVFIFCDLYENELYWNDLQCDRPLLIQYGLWVFMGGDCV